MGPSSKGAKPLHVPFLFLQTNINANQVTLGVDSQIVNAHARSAGTAEQVITRLGREAVLGQPVPSTRVFNLVMGNVDEEVAILGADGAVGADDGGKDVAPGSRGACWIVRAVAPQ